MPNRVTPVPLPQSGPRCENQVDLCTERDGWILCCGFCRMVVAAQAPHPIQAGEIYD